jgi:uncharacterized YigZ family protein
MAYTLAGPARYQEDIKKSRFLALAEPVGSVQQALLFFQAHSVPEATHNCWAYKLGSDYRFNDDGEPGGTAGRPILQAIEGQQCDRVAVLVIRWFGGVKLGTGGLVRAYGGTAAQCLRLAEKTELVDEVSVTCACAFSDMALVQSRLLALNARLEEETFDAAGVRWVWSIPRSVERDAAALFGNLTRGQGSWQVREPAGL